MKIGILTQPLMLNYGGLLQAYALQTVLKRMGHDAWIVNRCHSERPLWHQIGGVLKWFVKERILHRKNKVSCPFYPTQNQFLIIGKFISKFVVTYITPVTSPIFSIFELENESNSQLFDVYIVGSDQVWRPCYSPCLTNYFLDFINQDSIKKIAYSASFGVDNWEFSINQTKRCSILAQKFDAISVREDSGIFLCGKYLKVNAIQTLDPTLLLNKSDYLQLIKENDEEPCEGNLLTYILDNSTEKKIMVSAVASQLNLSPFSVMPFQTLNWGNQNEIENCIYPSVTKWLRGFLDAEFIVADSFHGCVFSIIFNKPFIVIGNEGRGMARFTSLLRIFNLESRLISSMKELENFEFRKNIDWEKVNLIREKWVKLSLDYLKENIEK